MEPTIENLECHVIDSVQCQMFAARWMIEREHDSDIATDVHSRRAQLRAFQKHVMDLFHDVLIQTSRIDDEYLDDDDPDVVDLYKVYQAFVDIFPQYDVVSIVPMTMTGAVAFVVQFKPM